MWLTAIRVKEVGYMVLGILIVRRLLVGRVSIAATKDKPSNLRTRAGGFFVKANNEWCKLKTQEVFSGKTTKTTKRLLEK